MKRLALPLLVLFTLTLGCKQTDDPVDAQPKTVSDLLTETPSFSLLKAAVQQAGMNDALKAPTLTLFAPTDDAFKAKGFSTPESFRTISVDALRNWLRYHLIVGVVTTKTPELASSTNLPVESSATAALFLTNTTAGLFVNGTKAVITDQVVANGIVHTIGTVLSAPAGDAVATLKSRTDVNLLVAAVTRAATVRPDLLVILNGTTTSPTLKQITIFAPNDAAFIAAGYRTLTDINAASPTTLANLITYHTVPGLVFANQLQAGQLTTISSAANNKLTIALPASGLTLKGNSNTTLATIKEANVVSRNAIIHIIDQVLQQ